MVESKRLAKTGLSTGALDREKGDIFFLQENWNRICAPEPEEAGKMHSLIFWNKTDSKDKPSWDKQVSSDCFCYL
jgi:hypothetical protein